MALDAQYNLEDLHNAAEALVFKELEQQLMATGSDVPKDQDSVVDMAALALNLVAPMYRANLLGRMYTSALSDAHHQEIEKAVAKAIKKISGNPRD